jgi:hypothetical protein
MIISTTHSISCQFTLSRSFVRKSIMSCNYSHHSIKINIHYNSSDSSCLTQQVSLEEQELLTLPEHLSSPLFFSGVRVTWSIVLCAMFCRSLFVFLSFFFNNCVVCPSSIYGFWLPLWYLQTLFNIITFSYLVFKKNLYSLN